MLILPTLLALAVLPVTLPRFLADPPLPPEIEGVAIPALLPILLPYHTKAKQSEGGGRETERTRIKFEARSGGTKQVSSCR